MPPQDLTAKIACGVLSLLCYGSFTWSILRFFNRGQGMGVRMKAISITGIASMVGHLTGMILLPRLDEVRICVAVLLFVMSLGFFWWALRTTWQTKLPIAFSSTEPTRLVRQGPYRMVRHPIYLSYMLAWIAGAVTIPSWWPWGVPAIMGLQYLSAIRQEEKMFLSGFLSTEYRAYIASVGMMFPNPIKIIRSGGYSKSGI